MRNRSIGLGISLAVALGISATGLAQQAVQWRVEDGGNGHWYAAVAFEAPTDWPQASSAAMSAGGHLVSITSANENSLVRQLGQPSQYWVGSHGPWIGASQAPGSPEPGGGWAWSDGSPWSFTDWGLGEPNNACYATPEDAIHLYGSGMRWNDLPGAVPACNDGWPRSAIIEWSADCNGDGIVDYGQILDGTLSDRDGDGVPDECEYGYLVGTAGFEVIPPLPLREFDIGEGSAVGIRPDGAVLSFLGGSAQTSSGPFATASAGLGFVVAIRADGTLLGLGDNAFGRLNVPAGTFQRVSAADATWHVAAIRTDGAAVCWGYNNYGQANAPSGSFAAIAAGGHQGWSGFTVAARVDGSLVGWGNNTWGQRNVPGGNVFRTVAAGYYHALAIRFDGTLAGWGYNVNGQCVVPPGQFIDIACGSNESVALRLDGTVATFGSLQPSASALFAGRTGVVSVRTLCCGSAALLERRDCDGNGINDAVLIALDPLQDANANGVLDCCDQGIECDCPADINQSGTIDAEDLAYVLFAWGMTGSKAGGADINGDATVDANDLSLVLGSWGPCPN